MLHEMGIETGIDLDALVEVARDVALFGRRWLAHPRRGADRLAPRRERRPRHEGPPRRRQDLRGQRGHPRALLADLDAQLAHARAGGGAVAAERHVARGKLLARDRVARLLDPGAPFLELAPLAAHGLYDGDAPAAGIVAGVGRVHGREVVVVANDARPSRAARTSR